MAGRRNLIACIIRFCLASVFIQAGTVCSFAEGGGDAESGFPTIKFEYKDGTIWRPAGFWRLKESFNDGVCHKLAAAFQKPWGALTPGEGGGRWDYDNRRFLGTKYSVKWTALVFDYDRSRAAHRVQIDLNNDGQDEVIYRVPHYLASVMNNGLYWTNSFPEEEVKFTVQRLHEIMGKHLTEPGLEGMREGALYVYGDKYASKLAVDPLFRTSVIVEIADIEGKNYILATQASYSHKPLDIVVYQTFDKRRHDVICHFISTAQLD